MYPVPRLPTSPAANTLPPPANPHPPRSSSLQLKSLIPFPPAVLRCVFSHLSNPDLLECVLVNSIFYRWAAPLVYTRICLDQYGAWPKFAENNGTIDPCTLTAKERVLQGHWLREEVRYVDVSAHSTRQCIPNKNEWFKPLLPALPNLVTLRVFTENPWKVQSEQRAFHTADFYLQQLEHQPQCSALARLRPRKLVVIGGPPTYRDTTLTVLPYSVLESVDKYTLILTVDKPLIAADPQSHLPSLRAAQIVSQIISVPFATLTVVFFSSGPYDPWRSLESLDSPSTKGDIDDTWAGRLFGELAKRIAQLPSRLCITFVNVGCVDKAAATPVGNNLKAQQAIKNHFDGATVQAQRDNPTTRSGSPSVEFISMVSYLERNDWQDELENPMVEKWHLHAQGKLRFGSKMCLNSYLGTP